MLYSRAPSIQGHLVLERARSINFSCVLYSRARSIRGARSNQRNTVVAFLSLIGDVFRLEFYYKGRKSFKFVKTKGLAFFFY